MAVEGLSLLFWWGFCLFWNTSFTWQLLKICRFTHVDEDVWGSFSSFWDANYLRISHRTNEVPCYTQLSKFILEILTMGECHPKDTGLSKSTTVVCSCCINLLCLWLYVCLVPATTVMPLCSVSVWIPGILEAAGNFSFAI